MEDHKTPKTWEEAIKMGICVMFFRRGCTSKVLARGLCSCHYHIALRAVKAGRITWELLEQRQKALPKVDPLSTLEKFAKEFED